MTKYYYEGKHLKDVCEENNIKYLTVLKRINNFKRKNTDLSDDEIVYKLLTENYLLFYRGMPLKEYCNDNDIDFNKLKAYIIQERKNKPELTDNNIIDNYIEKNKHHGNFKHFYMGTTLKEYCEKNDIHYPTIIRTINRIKEKTISIKYNDNEIINKVLENYLKNETVLKNKCELYKVDYNNINELIELEFTNNQAFNLIWFFSDIEENNNKKITNKKVKEIVSLAHSIENKKYEPKFKDLYNLIGILRCELYDTREIIINLLKNAIIKSINNFCTNYNINLNGKEKTIIYNDIKYNLIHYISYTNTKIYDELIKEMNNIIRTYYRAYLKNSKKDKVFIKK